MRLLLVVVEGEHDVVFVERSLRIHADFKEFGRAINEFPTPLGAGPSSSASFLHKHLSHAADAKLRDVKRPPLPRPESAVHRESDDVLALVLQAKGVTQMVPVAEFLKTFFKLLDSSTYEVAACATAIVVDADQVGATERAAEVKKAIGPVVDLPGVTPLEHGAWCATAKGPLGVWVFHDSTTKCGTLEDILEPIGQTAYGGYWSAAEAFIDKTVRQPRHDRKKSAVDRSSALRVKAVLTAAGQFEFPGAPMHGMLGHEALLGDHLKNSSDSLALATFLASVPW